MIKQQPLLLCSRSSIGLFSAEDVFAAISHLVAEYPNFEYWFHQLVVPGIRNGTRRIFVSATEGRLIGVAIAKRTPFERKLCTLWIAPEARTIGLAARLAVESFSWLETDKPLFTVPECRISDFRTLLSHWNFSGTQVLNNRYRPNCKEYIFNGRLDLLI